MTSETSSLRALWHQVQKQEGAPNARSSHAVAVIGHKAYVFGGEFEPRVPIDNLIHVFDLETETWSVAEVKGEAPLPRVGVTMAAVGEFIYVFAGRDDKHEELNEFFSFNTITGEWKLLSSGDSSPPHRSYHAFAADLEGKRLYAFGGCGQNGRLNDLWAFDIETGKWLSLPAPPPESTCVPRGGPGLAVVNGAVWVIFGFCGHELTDVHRYDTKKQVWEEVKISGDNPTGRSVFGTATIGKYIVLYGGEVDPSDQGHMGAGAFSGDVYFLDTENLTWTRGEVEAEEGQHPGARGWFAAASFGNAMLVYGGNSDSNDRLDDMHVLKIQA
ncbi:hypothetical protein O6H91_09G072000 [Diphasiastrum complanatum]|uniref:Uncharacterized protein n=2 Tax=Diphasiastrum complanatum TaxID=34168 RepID=A0ACC2CRP2_DIPCM|nr:hypothetical protein O6H91_09G072000 [Diphasiastrum complanatum]KAJ7544277.1 hypothetical protein O6H91_09G072000 [Diphasiastrum complanatum]